MEDVFYRPEIDSFTLNCPKGNLIQFSSAKLYRGDCLLGDALSYMRTACFLSDRCPTGLDHFNFNNSACPNSQIDNHIRIQWFCEPRIGSTGTHTNNFCEDTVPNQGHYFMLTSQTYTAEKCMCRVKVPANHEVIVQFTYSIPSGIIRNCSSHLLIGEDSSSVTKVCSQETAKLDCKDEDRVLYFAIEKLSEMKIYYNAEFLGRNTHFLKHIPLGLII